MENKNKYIKQILISLLCLSLCLASLYFSSNKSLFYNGSHHTFAATFMTMNNPYYEIINNEIKKKVNSLGDDLITLNPLLDPDKQNEQIEYFIQQNVDVIFVTPVDETKIEGALKKAKQKGISIIVVDAPISDTDLIDCTIVSDNYDAGVQCAKAMMKQKDHADIVLLEHQEAISARERIRGFVETIHADPNYKIIDRAECFGQIEYAFPAMQELLEKHHNIDVVFALNDQSAMGALAAIHHLNRNDILVYGVDGTPECKRMIANQLGISGTCLQYPIEIGQKAVEVSYDLLNRKDVPSLITINVSYVDEQNIDSIDLEGWQ